MLEDDGRTLFSKDGLKQVTYKNNSATYRVLESLGWADFIRTRLFPDYATRAIARARQTAQKRATLATTKVRVTDALQGIERLQVGRFSGCENLVCKTQ